MAVAPLQPDLSPDALTPTEAAARAQFTTNWLYELCRRGQGPPSFKRRGRRYFPRAAFESWLAKYDRNVGGAA